MIGMIAAFAAMIATGAALGIIVIVSVGVRREDKTRLTAASPDALASGVRAVTALRVATGPAQHRD
jgi:hypothetical protein